MVYRALGDAMHGPIHALALKTFTPQIGQSRVEDVNDQALKERIEGTLGESRVVLFMKGNRNFPACGFSAQVVSILSRRAPNSKT